MTMTTSTLTDEGKRNVESSLRLAIRILKETERFITSAEGSLSHDGHIGEKDPLANELQTLRDILRVARGALVTEADRLQSEVV